MKSKSQGMTDLADGSAIVALYGIFGNGEHQGDFRYGLALGTQKQHFVLSAGSHRLNHIFHQGQAYRIWTALDQMRQMAGHPGTLKGIRKPGNLVRSTATLSNGIVTQFGHVSSHLKRAIQQALLQKPMVKSELVLI